MVPRFMVRAEGLEPPTLWFEAKCSIQLSYARISTERGNGTRFLDQGQKIVHHCDVRIGSSAVEQVTLNHLVVGSNPARCTKKDSPYRRVLFINKNGLLLILLRSLQKDSTSSI